VKSKNKSLKKDSFIWCENAKLWSVELEGSHQEIVWTGK